MALPPISPSGVSTAFIYPRQTTTRGTGIGPQINADPGDTNPPIIFEPPFPLSNADLLLWIIATGASPNWGGCTVNVSVDNTSYTPIGTILAGGIQGVLTAVFASGSDPDTTHTLSVNLTESLSQLLVGTMQDADDFLTLCYCDGELISYSAASLTSAFHYDLGTYIRRGCYGTAIGSHAIGTMFGRIVGSTFQQQFPANLVGKTLYFKFPSFNTFGTNAQQLSAVPFYTYVLTGLGQKNAYKWFQAFSVGGTFAQMTTDPWDGNYEIFDVQAPVDLTFPANFATSPTPGCEVAPAATVTLHFQTIHAGTPTAVGTLTINSAATTGTYSVSAGFTLPAGDRLRCYAIAAVDTTIAGVFGTIAGTR
jgi:hypothetical protein